MRINGRPVDLMWPGSPHITHGSSIAECSSSACYSLPCINGGTCQPTKESYRCSCVDGFSGIIYEFSTFLIMFHGMFGTIHLVLDDILMGLVVTYEFILYLLTINYK